MRVSVCVSVSDHIVRTTRPIFRQFFLSMSPMAVARSSPGGVDHPALCTSGFVDDVIFAHKPIARRRRPAEAQCTRSLGPGYKLCAVIPAAGQRTHETTFRALKVTSQVATPGGGVCGLQLSCYYLSFVYDEVVTTVCAADLSTLADQLMTGEVSARNDRRTLVGTRTQRIVALTVHVTLCHIHTLQSITLRPDLQNNLRFITRLS